MASAATFKPDGTATVAFSGDSNPLEKALEKAERALSAFVSSTSKYLDAFDARVAQAFGKFSGTTEKTFDAFDARVARSFRDFSARKIDFPKPERATSFGGGGVGANPPTTAGGFGDDDVPSRPTVDVSLSSFAANSAALAGLKSFGKSALDAFVGFGDAMDKMSARTGFSVEALSALSHAAGQCGTTLETIEAASRGATNVLAQAANGSKEAADKFARLGLSVDELLATSPEEQFRTLVRAIASVENPTLRSAYAMQIFGEQGAQLGPMINGGADALDAYLQEAKDAGVVMTRDAATGAAAFADAIGRLKSSFKGLSLTVAGNLAPTIKTGADFFATLVRGANRIAQDFPTATKALEGIIASLVGFQAASYAASRVAELGKSFWDASKGAFAAAQKVAAFAAASRANALAVAGLAGGIVALTAAVVAYVGASANAKNVWSDEAASALEAGNAARRADEERFERLKSLAEQESLTNSERAEAVGLAAELTSKYGEIGVAVDAVAGKISIATDAQEKLNRKILEGKKAEIDAALAEAKNNAEDGVIEKRIAKETVSGAELAIGKKRGQSWGDYFTSFESYESDDDARVAIASGDESFRSRVDAEKKKNDAQIKSLEAQQEQLAALLNARNDAASTSAPVGAAAQVAGAENAAKKIADLDARIAKSAEDAARRSRTETENKIADVERETRAYLDALNARLELERAKPETERDAGKIAELEEAKQAATDDRDDRIDRIRADAAAKEADAERAAQAERERVFADARNAEEALSDATKTETEKRIEQIDKETDALKRKLEAARDAATTDEERAEWQKKLDDADAKGKERKNAYLDEATANAPTKLEIETERKRAELGEIYARATAGTSRRGDDARAATLQTEIAANEETATRDALAETRKKLTAALDAFSAAQKGGDKLEIADASKDVETAKSEYASAFAAMKSLFDDKFDVGGKAAEDEFVDSIDERVERAGSKLSSGGVALSALDAQKLGANANPWETQEKETRKTNSILGEIRDRVVGGAFAAKAL